MSLTILAIGDPHFRVDNIDESTTFLRELEKWIKDNLNTFDIIIVLGDILHYHEKLHTFALNIAFNFFEMLTSYKTTFCLVGNHDATSNTIFLTDNHWMNILKKWPNLHIIDKPFHYSQNNKQIVLCPYVPDGKLVEALDTIGRDTWTDTSCVFVHQSLNGAKMGAIFVENVEEWKDEYPMLISGHMHDKQRVKPNLYYTGSSMQHAFGESEDKCLCLVTLGNQVVIDDIYLQIKKKKILYASLDDIEKVKDKLNNKSESDTTEYKVVIKGTQEELKTFKKTKDFKELEKISKKIQLKSQIIDTISTSTTAGECSSDPKFVNILQRIVEDLNDPFANSFLQSMISPILGHPIVEDISDKDVFIINKKN